MHYYIKRKYCHYIRNKKVISCKGSETKRLLSETEGSPTNLTDNCLISPVPQKELRPVSNNIRDKAENLGAKHQSLPASHHNSVHPHNHPRILVGLLRLKALSGKIMPFAPKSNKKNTGPSGLDHLGARKNENKRTRRLEPGSLRYSLFIIPLLLLIFMFHLLLNCAAVSITE